MRARENVPDNDGLHLAQPENPRVRSVGEATRQIITGRNDRVLPFAWAMTSVEFLVKTNWQPSSETRHRCAAAVLKVVAADTCVQWCEESVTLIRCTPWSTR